MLAAQHGLPALRERNANVQCGITIPVCDPPPNIQNITVLPPLGAGVEGA